MKCEKVRRFATSGLLALVAMLASSASVTRAEVLSWDFSVDPSDAFYGANAMTEYAGDGGGYTGSGGYGAGLGLLGDGTAEFADSSSNNVLGSGQSLGGNYGFVKGGITGPLTIEFRVKVIENVIENEGRSMAYAQGLGNGRAIHLDTDMIRIVGAGVHAQWPVDFTVFQIIRISLPNNSTMDGYRWNGASWEHLGQVTNFGGTGPPTAELGNAGGVSVGSMEGSGTQSGKYHMDYVRMDNAQALGGAGSPLPAPDPVCLESVTPSAAQALTGYEGGASQFPFASIDLGTGNVSDGITHVVCCDGLSSGTTIGGRNCRQSNPPTHPYMYFNASDGLVFNGNRPNLTITIDYYDTGTQTINLEYDSAISPYEAVPIVTLTNTNTWKTASVNVTNAKFANSENGGSDFRISSGPGIFYLDKVSITEPGGPYVNYTVGNPGDIAFNWTAAEINCDGTANDYPWLSLSAAAGALNPGETDPVKASVDTTSLTAGSYTAFLKFTSDCTLPACFTESFTLNPGDLNGQNGWTGDTNEFQVTAGGELNLNGSGDGTRTITHAVGCSGEAEMSIKVKAKLGGSIPPVVTFWQFKAIDSGGNNLGFWQGTQEEFRAKELQGGGASDPPTSLQSTYQTLEMRLKPACRETSYYVDNVHIITYPWPLAATGTAANVQFVRLPAETSGTDFVLFDDLSITLAGNELIRRIDLNVVGCSLTVVDPRIRFTGQCGSSSIVTETFTIKNNGAFDWTGFTADQFGTSRPWLISVAETSSPVLRGETATVVATIDWSQVTVAEGARIRFGADCGAGFVFDTPSLGGGIETINVPGTTPAGWKLTYKGDVVPNTNDAAGPGYRFNLFEGNDQGAIVTDPDADDQSAYHLNDSSSDKTKWQLVQNDGSPPLGVFNNFGATVVGRVKTITSNNNSTDQRNLAIFDGTIAAAAWWAGPDNRIVEVNRGNSVVVPGDNLYHIIRVTAQTEGVGAGLGNIIKIYLDEDPNPVMVLTGAANSSADSAVEGFGFCTGSTSQSQEIYFDWVTGTNQGAFAPGEELDCIGSFPPVSNCNVPRVDADADGDVDMDDFAVFQTCYTGSLFSPPPLSLVCDCFDSDNDNDVDVTDFNNFVDCETGASVPWVASVNCPN